MKRNEIIGVNLKVKRVKNEERGQYDMSHPDPKSKYKLSVP